MNLQCRSQFATIYKSASQLAKVVSEDWCARELYCPACDCDRLFASKPNSPAVDFVCPACKQIFELKSSKSWNLRKVVDSGYEAMMRAIRADQAPNLMLLQYSPDWFVTNLLLVPRLFFTESVIEKRRALSPSARRAGWVGCNILLTQIPADGKIEMVSGGIPAPAGKVRAEFAKIRGLAQLTPSARGWTVDVLNIVRRLGKSRFVLADLYNLDAELAVLHPHNQNIRPKIRQQLQVLRDMGIIQFTTPGQYRLTGQP